MKAQFAQLDRTASYVWQLVGGGGGGGGGGGYQQNNLLQGSLLLPSEASRSGDS